MKFSWKSIGLVGSVLAFGGSLAAREDASALLKYYPTSCTELYFTDSGNSEGASGRVHSFEIEVHCHVDSAQGKPLDGLSARYEDLVDGKLADKTRVRLAPSAKLETPQVGFSGVRFPTQESLVDGSFVVKTDTSLQVNSTKTNWIYESQLKELVKTDENSKLTRHLTKQVEVTEVSGKYHVVVNMSLKIKPPKLVPDSILVPQAKKSAIKQLAPDVYMHMDVISGYLTR